jgi:hypothetical protein
MVLWSFSAFGEEWTAEQKEFWEIVKADYNKFTEGDIEGLAVSRHKDTLIWWGSKPIPFNKNSAISGYRGWINYDNPIKWELDPLAITIVGDVATVAVQYKYSGKNSSGSGRDLETWMKKDGKWLLINSFSASCDKLPPCK